MQGRVAFGGLLAALVAGAAIAADPPRPLALVEDVSDAPAANLRRFDYVYPGARIDLRPNGALTIAWFDSCVVETFTGGEVRLEKARARVSGGGRSVQRTRPCPTSALKLAPSRSEAGVAVKRVTPFDETAWKEITIRAERPTFVWPASDKTAEATVIVNFLDASPRREVWRGKAAGNQMEYPADAPKLEPGMPYEVRVERAGEPTVGLAFSIDPGLAAEDALTASVVPLGL